MAVSRSIYIGPINDKPRFPLSDFVDLTSFIP